MLFRLLTACSLQRILHIIFMYSILMNILELVKTVIQNYLDILLTMVRGYSKNSLNIMHIYIINEQNVFYSIWSTLKFIKYLFFLNLA